MPPRQPFPIHWLMTDERLGDPVALVRRLPRGTGVVFRQHATARAERQRMLREAAGIAAGGRVLLVRGGADGIGSTFLPRHGRRPRSLSAPVHSRAEAVTASRSGAAILFVSPVFPTRSHPGTPALGAWRAAAIVRGLPVWKVALGGMNPSRFARIKRLGFDGWAAIDWWADALLNGKPSPSKALGS